MTLVIQVRTLELTIGSHVPPCLIAVKPFLVFFLPRRILDTERVPLPVGNFRATGGWSRHGPAAWTLVIRRALSNLHGGA